MPWPYSGASLGGELAAHVTRLDGGRWAREKAQRMNRLQAGHRCVCSGSPCRLQEPQRQSPSPPLPRTHLNHPRLHIDFHWRLSFGEKVWETFTKESGLTPRLSEEFWRRGLWPEPCLHSVPRKGRVLDTVITETIFTDFCS